MKSPSHDPDKYLPTEEAQDLGVVLEINRRLLHPRGLALEVARITDEAVTSIALTDEELVALRELAYGHPVAEKLHGDLWRFEVGQSYITGIQDHRADPEGIYFGDLNAEDVEHAKAFEGLLDERRAEKRRLRLGYVVQPLG